MSDMSTSERCGRPFPMDNPIGYCDTFAAVTLEIDLVSVLLRSAMSMY